MRVWTTGPDGVPREARVDASVMPVRGVAIWVQGEDGRAKRLKVIAIAFEDPRIALHPEGAVVGVDPEDSDETQVISPIDPEEFERGG